MAEAHAGLVLESQLTKRKRTLSHKLAEENKMLAKEQKAE